MSPDIEQTLRSMISEALHEPIPDSVSTVEGFEIIIKTMQRNLREWGKCHQRHMLAESELAAIWGIGGTHTPDVCGKVRDRIQSEQLELEKEIVFEEIFCYD